MPWATKIYKRDMDVTRYNVPFLLHPYIALYSTRGCPAQCTFCLWPQTLSGHAWRKRSSDDVAAEMAWAKQNFPEVKEFFFDDDTFNIQKARTIELCEKLKPLNLTWSCTSRVTTDYDTLKAMSEAGCRLLIVGFESGDPQILKNIKKGATVERAPPICQGLPRPRPHHSRRLHSRPARRNQRVHPQHHQLRQDSRLRNHPGQRCPRLSRHRVLRVRPKNGFITNEKMEDGGGHQMAHIEYPGLPTDYVMEMVHKILRRVLLPSQGCFPRRLEGNPESRCPPALCRGQVVHEAARAAQQGIQDRAQPESRSINPGQRRRVAKPDCISEIEVPRSCRALRHEWDTKALNYLQGIFSISIRERH